MQYNKNKLIIGGGIAVVLIAGIAVLHFKSGTGVTTGGSATDTAALYTVGATLTGDSQSASTATGLVQAGFVGGKYRLVAAFAGIPEPKPGYFYHAWLRKENSEDAVSLGKVEKIKGIYSNVFEVDQDLSEYTTYTLTLQPETDEEHSGETILEGKLTKK